MPKWFRPRVELKDKAVVLFDGVCGLCNRTVDFAIDKDRERVLRFAPLQGETAAAVFRRHPGAANDLSSVILVLHIGEEQEALFHRSDAVFRMLDIIGGIWRPVSWLRFVPRFFRDGVYNCIARNRYRWFGKRETCRVPAPGNRERFMP